MIKRLLKYVLPAIIIAIVLTAVYSQKSYKNGTFEGRSRSKYTNEPFVAISKVFISKGEIDSVQFVIVDTSKNEIFNEKYEIHFIGNQEYIDQCRNDWKGVTQYPVSFAKLKDLDKIDAVSGATWSYNMFKSATQLALDKAKIK
jgi:major membrane immunogen (membrane-anchored lipoprotein)